MNRILFITLYICIGACSQKADMRKNRSIATIAFGSCSKQDLPEKQLWQEVNKTNPDLWIWLGDNIYGDTEDMQVMREKYQLQKSHPDYQRLMSTSDVIGIWDDHDYGANDAGKEYPMKKESKNELFDFLDVASNHPARARAGAYQSYTYSGEEMTIKIILLDTRYFRDELKWQNPGTAQKASITNPTGDILGAGQWEWLEEQVTDENIDLLLIASGIQILPTEHRWEKWANFPKSREKLLNLIASQVDVPVVLISGDRHISETSKIELNGYPFPVWEFTSSSLTSPASTKEPEPNFYRDKEIVYPRNFAVLNIQKDNSVVSGEVSFIGSQNEVLQAHTFSFTVE